MEPSADRKRIIATKSYAAIAKTKVVVSILSVANRIQRDRQPYTKTNAPLTMTGKCSIRSSTNIHFLSKFYVWLWQSLGLSNHLSY